MSKSADFILGVDGGATKTVARLVHLESSKTWLETSGPSSLTNDYQGAVDTLEEICTSLCLKANSTLDNVVGVFGLAGAGNDALADKIYHKFKDELFCLEVCTDAKTSVYGANNGSPVAVVALGTGSVGMRLDPIGKNTLTGGWGFLLGDEGGGAKLGLHAIQATMAEIQNLGQAKSPLAIAIVEKVGLTRTEIITWTVKAKPIDFAQHAPLVFEHYENCKMAQTILQKHLRSVEELISNTQAKTNLPVVLLGSLGMPTYELLSKSTQKKIIKAKGNALDGACFLARKNRENIHSKIKEVKLNDYAG
jgi:glucosamine kinase